MKNCPTNHFSGLEKARETGGDGHEFITFSRNRLGMLYFYAWPPSASEGERSKLSAVLEKTKYGVTIDFIVQSNEEE